MRHLNLHQPAQTDRNNFNVLGYGRDLVDRLGVALILRFELELVHHRKDQAATFKIPVLRRQVVLIRIAQSQAVHVQHALVLRIYLKPGDGSKHRCRLKRVQHASDNTHRPRRHDEPTALKNDMPILP